MTMRNPMPGFRSVRRDQLRQERVHDTYKLAQKPAEPAVCSVCGVVFHEGRWQWLPATAGAKEITCPACHRIQDRFPAGFVHVGGAFFAAHRDELLKLLRHHEEREGKEHPLSRIMAVEEEAGGVLVTTTDIHLARNLVEALHHAYQGNLDFHYNEAENLLRVYWER